MKSHFEYSGICGICFEPIEKGDEMYIRPGKRMFHTKCAAQHPNDYYLALERRLAKRDKNKGKA